MLTPYAPSRSRIVAVITGSRSGERYYESSPWIIRALLDLGHQVVKYELDGQGNRDGHDEIHLPLHLLGACPEVVWGTGLGASAEDLLPAFFETLVPGTPYVGSSSRATHIGMDKEASKDAFRALGLPIPDSACFIPHLTPYGTAFQVSKPADAEFLTQDGQPDFVRLAERLGLPLVVKPCGAGASLGLSLVEAAETLASVFVPTAQRYGPLLVEQYIPSSSSDAEVEYSACLLEGAEPLPVFEVRSPGVYTTAQKISGARSRPLSGPLAAALQDVAWSIFTYLGCRGFARVDFRMTPSGTPYPLEINTNPGLIPSVSLFPKACAEIGLSYEQMIAHILVSAFRPHPRAVPPVAAEDAPPFPEAFRPLLPTLPADLQPTGFYRSADCARSQPIRIAAYRC